VEDEVEVVVFENRLFMFGKEYGTWLLLLGLVAALVDGGEGKMSAVGFVDGIVVLVTCDIGFVVSLGFIVGNEGV
jgi:hypothetical protein